jgi:2-oxoglutarate-Fe(II)-dependent oxygenase superfamily protein
VADEFRSWLLPAADNPFEELLAAVELDDVTKGRRGTVLVEVDARGVPIVRTTTQYREPARPFREIHDRLAREIRARGSLSHAFNNALVEHYTSAYSTMKRHSDQALDLADASSIAVYSCYRDPRRPSRRLLVKPKGEGTAFEVPLDHGSVVAFSLDTNRRFTHAIALRANAPDNDWLGITFRTSRTFVRFVDGHPTLPDGAHLTLASEEQRREFFQMRRRENDETSFTYPPISYTISESDLWPPSGQ